MYVNSVRHRVSGPVDEEVERPHREVRRTTFVLEVVHA